jgi:predicted enzyme related to lactoylglutathione lyase
VLNGLETVVYYVEDLKAAAAWYEKVLGIKPNHDTPYYVGFTVAGHELGLHPAGDDPRKPGTDGQTAYWSVVDARGAVAHFVEHGAREYKPPEDVGGGILIGSVLDPFGNAVGLIQNPNSPNKR